MLIVYIIDTMLVEDEGDLTDIFIYHTAGIVLLWNDFMQRSLRLFHV